ncbi:EamA family transporter [Agrococcus baldri]|uniref:EamA family transporter n=1 Tax=Agrococcus baldri TaxID=153730 RepID=UPI001649B63A|nr:EamA family transporter [Agrococcus baldri]
MFAVVLAVVAAFGYGLSDLAGGRAAERLDARVVAGVSQAIACGIALLLLALPLAPREPAVADVLLAIGAGLGSAVGNVCIYAGIARHGATAVAPTSGLVAIVLPVTVGLAAGESLTAPQALGLALAMPAVWIVSGNGIRRPRDPRALLAGAAAGAGFGTQFACLGLTGVDAGLVPLAVSQSVSVLVLVLLALGAGRPSSRPETGPIAVAILAGLLAGAATASFQIAARTGELAVAAVITSLYPAVTVVAAAAVAHRWWSRREGVGLAMSTVALVLIGL